MSERLLKFLTLLFISFVVVGCGSSDEEVKEQVENQEQVEQVEGSPLPILFIHGTSGSASQFQSQAQRFLANGYTLDHLDAWEYDSGPLAQAAVVLALASIEANGDATAEFAAISAYTSVLYGLAEEKYYAEINAKIDGLLAATGASQINLMGHSLGTIISNVFLKNANSDDRVAHYVNLDGTTGQGTGTPFGGVETLALWARTNSGVNDQGEEVERTVALGDTAIDDYDVNQAHIEVATSATTFAKAYEFFNDEAPTTTDIPDVEGDSVTIAGRANIFPENVGADDMTLYIYTLDPATGIRSSSEPINAGGYDIGSEGGWGPVEISKGGAYEFELVHDTVSMGTHHFYMEPFYADDYFIRLNTGRVNEGFAYDLNRSGNHTNLMIARDR